MVQVFLACSHERQADASTAMLEANRQSIHAAPPSVPRGDQHAEDLAVAVGYEQTPGCLGEQLLQRLSRSL